MSLRSILGGSNRVKKRPAKSRASPCISGPSASASASSSSTCPDSLPRTKPPASGKGPGKTSSSFSTHDEDASVWFEGPFEAHGLVSSFVTDLTLRDVPQAIKYAREHMFSPLPTRGLSSTLTATVLSRRAALPPLLSTSHLYALLSSSTPTKIDRETAELAHAGVLRRVVVPRRGVVGEMVVLVGDLEGILRDAAAGGKTGSASSFSLLDEETVRRFVAWLRANPTSGEVPVSGDSSAEGGSCPPLPAQLDVLARAGFLTNPLQGGASLAGSSNSIFARPEDRTTLVSLATVARAASGTLGAVGGQGILREAGASGGGPGHGGSNEGLKLNVAVPGTGAFLKLVSGALEHLTYLVERMSSHEGPEYLIAEQWEGRTARAGGVYEAARLARGENVGTPAGRTRKWRDFSGLRFDWVLAEAVGAGLVEVFETGSVGRGVRLVR